MADDIGGRRYVPSDGRSLDHQLAETAPQYRTEPEFGGARSLDEAEDEIRDLKQILDFNGFGSRCGSYDCHCNTCSVKNCSCSNSHNE